MKNIFRILTLGLLLSGAWACSSVDEFVEPDVVPTPNDEKTITMVVENDAESRALFTGQNEDGDWELAFINGDEMVMWEVAAVTSRGYSHVRKYNPTSSELSDRNLKATFTYSVDSPYQVGDVYPGVSSYNIEDVYYTGLLPASGFPGFYANVDSNGNYIATVDPTLTEGQGDFIRLNVPREQTPTATSPDANAILLRAYDSELPEDGVINTRFKHILAYLKITVKGLPVDFVFNKMQISGQMLCNASSVGNKDYYSKYSVTEGFVANAKAGQMLIIHTDHLEKDENGCYTVWAACIDDPSPVPPTADYGTIVFSVYQNANAPLASKSIPITKEGGEVNGTRTIALKAGEVTSLTLNFGYGNDLTAPVVNASTTTVDAERSQVTFSWPVNNQAEHYCYTINGGEEQQTTSNAVSIHATPGSEVTIKVKACPAEGSGLVASGWTTKSITAAPYFEPLVMSEIEEVSINSYSATLSWAEVANAVSYAYKLGEEGSVNYLSASTNEYTFSGLEENTEYYLYMQALPEDGSTEYVASEWVEYYFKTTEKSPLTMSALSEVATTTSTTTLSWTAVEGAGGYAYKVGESGAETSMGNVTEYTITGLTHSTTYTIYVRALGAVNTDNGDSDWVSIDVTTEVATPLVMGAVTLGAVTDTTVILTWDEVANAVGYRYLLGDGTEGVAQSGVAITGLTPETTYTVQIMAVAEEASDYANSDWSAAVEFTTAEPAAPLNEWGSDALLGWSEAIGTTDLKADSNYNGLYFSLGGGSKGYSFVTEGDVTYLSSNENADKSKNLIYVVAESAGTYTMTITGYNPIAGKKIYWVVNGSKKAETTIDAAGDFTQTYTVEVAAGDMVGFATRQEGTHIYSIAWTPAE